MKSFGISVIRGIYKCLKESEDISKSDDVSDDVNDDAILHLGC